MPPTPVRSFTRYERFVIAVLAFLQFTIILDFMILSPLGAVLMRDLGIPTSRFGLVVSVYAFSAGASGILAAGFADRFDRKKMLLFFYTGFLIGTILCGVASSYHFLLIARMVTGLFGGVIGAISFAIIADLFPFQVRGRVMGVIQTSFAASQVAGIPLGLYLSNRFDWHAPFLMIAGVTAVAGVVIALALKPIDAHIGLQRASNPFSHLGRTLARSDYARAYATTALLVTGGFMMMPFGSAFAVNNLGISMDQLTKVYLVTGLASVIAGPLAGRLSDTIGKFTLFCGGTALSAVTVVVYTHLGVTPLWEVSALSAVMFVGITSRMIAASALTSAVPEPANRGAFLAVNASIQQLAGGMAAGAAGLIVHQLPNGPLQHYDRLGFVVLGAMTAAAAMLYTIHRDIAARTQAGAVTAPRPEAPVAESAG